ncbi:hypothetical protein NIP80_004763 [Salmonella enterica]|nr:hypothetical protein [Salmonella enterica subsp. enterica serovar Newport]EDM0764171.1 hypothetical protein [Salmonella enterica]EJJ1914576.1 hypothetical protein [Salmonella enterica]
MSNDVCGYIEPLLSKDAKNNLYSYVNNQNIGIASIQRNQLYNFPVNLLPDEGSWIFLISDKPGYPNASYLIDYLDYAAEADIGFPHKGKDRLNLLLDVLAKIFMITNAKKMVVALTECNQIEKIKKIKLSEMYNVIHSDFEEYQAPPDTLYEITM